jgi:tetratricopeptide (TPR) repeat protein
MQDGRIALVNQAVRVGPSDPFAHYARALVLSQPGQLADATKEFEKAVALRPGDYVLWLDLGNARDQSGDQDGALVAFKEAMRLAPYYARPRWQNGQLLLRAGRRDEAFDSLRGAVASRPTLLPEVIDLAWRAYGGDVAAVQRAVQPQTNQDRLVLSRFFARQGRMAEAVQLFRAAREIPGSERLAFLRELLDAKQFKEAYEIWSGGRKQTDSASGDGLDSITDGSFENTISADDPGFGWQLALRAAAVSLSLESNQPYAGTYSLLLRFGGDAQASTRLIKQLVRVSPLTHYRLSFAARTEKLVTGGAPLVIVTDASSKDESELAQSLPLPIGTNGWRDYSVEFTTKDTTGAVVIGVRRQNCTSDPCPVFGNIWFDAFSLQKL